jgi:hypothetical protein
MKLFTLQLSLASCYFLPLTSKYSPQCPVFIFNQCSSLSNERLRIKLYKTISKIIVLHTLIITFSDTVQNAKDSELNGRSTTLI